MSKKWSDVERAQRIAADAIGEHESFRAARCKGIYLLPQRAQVIEMCMPYAKHAGRKIIRLPEASRIDPKDIDAAAMVGLVEAVDSYKPALRKDIKLHIWWGVFHRVGEERTNGHWVVSRPDRAESRRYLGGKMTESERRTYEETFMLGVVDADQI